MIVQLKDEIVELRIELKAPLNIRSFVRYMRVKDGVEAGSIHSEKGSEIDQGLRSESRAHVSSLRPVSSFPLIAVLFDIIIFVGTEFL